MKVWLGWAFILVAFCTASSQDCGSDETLSGGSCMCNTTMYTPEATPPEPTLECLPGEMKLNLSKCQLEASKYDSENLHLKDDNCLGISEVDDIALIVVNTTTSSLACGNNMTVNGTYVTYSNILYIAAKVFGGGITARNNVTYKFSCSYPLNLPVALATAIHPVLGATEVTLPGQVGTVTVIMAAYIDPSYSVPYTDSTEPLQVQDPLYISVLAPDLDATLFAVQVTRVYATANSDPNTPVKYELITDGCPSPDLGDLETIRRNGATNEALFQISVFQISGQPSVYLFAEVRICAANCTLNCATGGRTRVQERSDSVTLRSGPFDSVSRENDNSGAAERFSRAWTMSALLLSLLGVQLL